MSEIWKPIKGYKDYEVSNLGGVRSLDRVSGKRTLKGQLLKGSVDEDGYLRVRVFKDGKAKGFGIHRLVAIAFIKNPKKKPHVNHLNGIKTDNRVENLEWATIAENNQHAYNMGLRKSQKGEDHGQSKLTSEQVAEIRRLRAEGQTCPQIAPQFGITQSAVSAICRNRLWVDPTETNITRHKEKLTWEDAEEIRKLSSGGMLQREIAARFSIDQTTVSLIVTGKHWSKKPSV